MCKPARVAMLAAGILITAAGMSQVNSPFSRFGIGDLTNARNVSSKGMGGIATTYTDIQSVNFINPASYSKIGFVTFDVGIETEFRTFSNQAKTDRFQSANLLFNYVAVGMPIKKSKDRTKTLWGLAFGLRPLSRIKYNIQDFGRVPGIDSSVTEYRGNGGLYRAFAGTGFNLGNLSLGINAGWVFGQQDMNTYRTLINDTTFYYTANFGQNTSISRFMADAGMMYSIKTSKTSEIRIGANGYLGGDANANRDVVSQTSFFNAFGSADTLDVVERKNMQGTYTMPAGYSIGISYDKRNDIMVSAEYEIVKWTNLDNYGQSNKMGDTKMFRAGVQWIPDALGGKKYFRQVAYRAGFFTGKDYVVVNDRQLPVWGVTVGGGFPIKRYNAYSTQYSTVNLSFEYGRRGGNETPYFERYFRLNLGLALSDIWFIPRQYD
jgi:hypothetical protein